MYVLPIAKVHVGVLGRASAPSILQIHLALLHGIDLMLLHDGLQMRLLLQEGGHGRLMGIFLLAVLLQKCPLILVDVLGNLLLFFLLRVLLIKQ